MRKRPLNEAAGAADPNSSIDIIVKSQQDQREVYFRTRRDVPIRRLLVSYCEKVQVDIATMVFLYNGDQVLRHNRTPAQLGMESGDEIDATTHADGGKAHVDN